MINNVIDYLAQSASSVPGRVALSDLSTQMTYQEVWHTISHAGNAIADHLCATGRAILVCIDHSVSDVLAFLSVTFSGNVYVPVDLSLPAERVRSIVDTIRPDAVIVHDMSPLPFDARPMAVWTLHELATSDHNGDMPWKACKDTDILYVMFTSGSTGTPKGVAISHRSVIDMAEQFDGVFHFGGEGQRVFGNQAPFDFDVSVKDIYLALKTGGRLEILEKKLFSFPKLLISRLNERRVNTIIWAVPALKLLAGFQAFRGEKPLYLRDILFSGEVMPPKTLAYWMESLPEARYVNLYGPTEITCNCTYHIVDRSDSLDNAIPIGRPFPNCSVFLLDGDTLVTEEGQPGEICVAGTCLALGYYRQPELTEAVFVQNPLCSVVPERIYRTGDVGYYRQGELVFLGRNDTQIKHMGHRIELAEIELRADCVDGVEVSACVYDEAATRIFLFYQGDRAPKTVLEALRAVLPKYMLPARLIPVTAFPQTRTGKIDRRALLKQAKGECANGKTL